MNNQEAGIFEKLHDFDFIDNVLNDVLYSDENEEDKAGAFYTIGKAYFELYSEYARAHQILLAIPEYFQDERYYFAVFSLCGKVAYHGGAYEKGLEECEIALKYSEQQGVDPLSRANLYLYLGLCAYELRILDKAIYYMTKANEYEFEDEEDNYRANFYLGMAYFRSEEYEKSIPYYHKATEKAMKVAEIIGKDVCTLPYYSNHYLGCIYAKIREFEEAVKYETLAFNYAITDEFKYFASFFLGDDYYLLKDYEKAVKYFNIALEYRKKEKEFNVRPDDLGRAEAHLRLGKSYYHLDENEKAIEQFKLFKKELKDKDRYYEYFYETGKAYADMKEYDSAIFNFEKALNLVDDDNDDKYYILYDLGVALYKADEYEDAVEVLQESLDYMETDTNKLYSYLYLAKCLYQLDEYQKSLEALREICDLEVGDYETCQVYTLIGENLYMLDEEEEAIKMLIFAKNHTENEYAIDKANYEIAKCYFSLENYEMTLKILSTLIENEYYNELYYFNYLLAGCFYQFEDRKNAQLFIARALEFGGDEYSYVLELKESIDEM